MVPVKEVHMWGIPGSPVLVWSGALVLVCLLGDRLCSLLSQSGVLWRALADSCTHGVVGVVSWAVVVTPGLSLSLLDRWAQCLLCGVLASIIDVDHFWQAGALDLKAAVSLQHRPPLHSTSLVVAVCAVLWVMAHVLGFSQLRQVALQCLVAWLSHHLRDASRRGLWFPPFGSTPPLPYAVYVGATVALGVLVHWMCSVYCQDTLSPQGRVIEILPQVIVNRST